MNGAPGSKKSVCIVGHGPSLQGKGLGKEIDKFDVVIRMMNCAWQDEKDYGLESDVSIHCPAQKHFADDPRMPAFCYFIYFPTGWERHPLLLNSSFRGIPSFGADEWLHDLHGENKPFSRGMAAALLATRFFWVKELCFAGMVKMLGVETKKNPDHHPSKLYEAHPYNGRTDTHDWENEALVLKAHAEELNIKLRILECPTKKKRKR